MRKPASDRRTDTHADRQDSTKTETATVFDTTCAITANIGSTVPSLFDKSYQL